MRKLSAALVAIGALAVAGGATAAGKYIITNVHQIKPSVRAQLRGKRGPRGVAGQTGAQGADGLVSVKTAASQVVDAAPCCTDASIIQVTAVCPAGSTVVSGGWIGDPNHPASAAFFLGNAPDVTDNGWTVLMVNADQNNPAGIQTFARCAFGGLGGAADAHAAGAGTIPMKAELAAARRLVRARRVALKSTRH